MPDDEPAPGTRGVPFSIAGNGATAARPIHSLTHLIDRRAAERPHDPALYTVVPERPWEVCTMTYAQLLRGIERLAWYYSAADDASRSRASESDPPPAPAPPNLRPARAPGAPPPPPATIALLLPTSLTLTLTELALHRLALTPLLLSPANTPAATAALLRATNARVLIHGAGARLTAVAREAKAMLAGEVELVEEKVYPIWGPGGVVAYDGTDGDAYTAIQPYPRVLTYEEETHRPAIILHSSGSTGTPKPLPGTHATVLANGAANWGLTAATVLPLFHGFGHHSTLRAISACKPLAVFPPHLPLTARNMVRFFDAVEAQTQTHLQQLVAVAYLLKLLAEDPPARARLARFDVVTFSGSALPDETGAALTSAGVRLLSQYGTTETGACLTSLRDFERDTGWDWVGPTESVLGRYKGKGEDDDTRDPERIGEFLRMEHRGAGLRECVILKGFASLAVSNRPDGGFATRDLFMAHAVLPRRYKYVGRLDDTLTQTLGEKTNPVPLELDIAGGSAWVSVAIVFGDGRPNIGALLLPSDDALAFLRARARTSTGTHPHALTLTPERAREVLLEKVWPAVDAANRAAPTHSRIAPEMVDFLITFTYAPDGAVTGVDGVEVPLATKGSILRAGCYARFADLISAIYERYESGGSSGVGGEGGGGGKAKRALDLPELEDFVHSTVLRVLGPHATTPATAITPATAPTPASETPPAPKTDTRTLGRTDDLFAYGVDSLQSARIRLVCLRELDLGEGVRSGRVAVGGSVVYEYPSVRRLAKYLYDLRMGGTRDGEEGEGGGKDVEEHATMRALVDTYAGSLVRPTGEAGVSPPHLSSPTSASSPRVVLLTGSTGSLGAHILHQLRLRPPSAISKVICLVRAPDDAVGEERVDASLKMRMLPGLGEISGGAGSLEEQSGGEEEGQGQGKGKVEVEVYAADLDKDDLGLGEAVYGRVVGEVTDVVHNAWAVNFNYTVASFEAAHIRGVHNLLNLCLRTRTRPSARSPTPATFYFSSSVAARQGRPPNSGLPVAEDISPDPADAARTGYARSKWVGEALCERAARERGVRVGVLRIGQLVGDSVSGVWNTTEAVPFMFRSAQVIGCVPDIDDHPSFLPTDIAGRAITEIICQPTVAGTSPSSETEGNVDAGAGATVYHVLNPNLQTSYREIWAFLSAAGLPCTVVDRHEWLRRLEEGPSDGEANPTYKLVDFYRARYGGPELKRAARFSVERTARVAPSVGAAPPVSRDLVAKWVAHWRAIGFLA